MVAAKLANISHGGSRVQAENLPLASVTQAQAAEMLNVSDRMVRAAKKVNEEAPLEVIQAVEQGAMSVHLASKVADLPDEAKAEMQICMSRKLLGMLLQKCLTSALPNH
jgi:hypothetical protein